ncbi:MAG: polymer-forming cytoskeletal protein [Oscillospiraceae bacterium]
MANKETSNFKAALNELLSGKITTEEPKKPPLFKEEEQPTPVPDTSEAQEKLMQAIENAQFNMEDETVVDSESQDLYKELEAEVVEMVQPAKEPVEAPREYEPIPQVSVVNMQHTMENLSTGSETVIAHDVVIEGNIKSSSKLRIVGEVTGDVKSTADVIIEGKVGGSIQGNNIFLSECEVNNNINASNEVNISERSMVNGDIKAGAVTSNGVVNGNLDAQSITLNGASRTVGDVKCKLIKIGEGAGLKGKLETID